MSDPAVLQKLTASVLPARKGKPAAPLIKVKGSPLLPQDGRLAKLMKSDKSDREILDELFLATLARDPSAEEQQVALAAIDKNRVEGAQNLQWALINQVEFFFNH